MCLYILAIKMKNATGGRWPIDDIQLDAGNSSKHIAIVYDESNK